MYRSRNNWSLSTLIGTYQLSGGTSERTSEAISVALYDTFSVQVGYANESGSPKLRIDIEGSADGTNWSVLKQLTDIVSATEKRLVCEHPCKWVRVKLSITSGTSISVTWVSVEAMT